MVWYTVQSTIRPDVISTTTSKIYNYVRKNIREVEVEDQSGGTRRVFEYEEAKVPKESWSMYQDLEQAKADIDYLSMLVEG